MTPGLVSIVVPTYQRTRLLQKTLNSLVDQSYRPIEIWVIDDGSEGEENRLLCERYPEVNYVRISNSGGPARPRNEGIRHAHGEFIAFSDDDDPWEPNKLQLQLEEFRKNDKVGLVHSCCQVIGPSDNLLGEIIGRPGDLLVKSGDVSKSMLGNWTIMTSTVVVRSIILKEVGWFNEEMPPFGEDMEYWCRCSFYTHFAYVDTPLVKYRRHAGISSAGRALYNQVPAHLMNALNDLDNEGKVHREDLPRLKNQVLRMQLKRLRPGFFSNLSRTFRWNPLWFLNFGNMKLFLKQFFSS